MLENKPRDAEMLEEETESVEGGGIERFAQDISRLGEEIEHYEGSAHEKAASLTRALNKLPQKQAVLLLARLQEAKDKLNSGMRKVANRYTVAAMLSLGALPSVAAEKQEDLSFSPVPQATLTLPDAPELSIPSLVDGPSSTEEPKTDFIEIVIDETKKRLEQKRDEAKKNLSSLTDGNKSVEDRAKAGVNLLKEAPGKLVEKVVPGVGRVLSALEKLMEAKEALNDGNVGKALKNLGIGLLDAKLFGLPSRFLKFFDKNKEEGVDSKAPSGEEVAP